MAQELRNPAENRSFETLLSPLRLGAAELPNRIAFTSHQTNLVVDHLPSEEFVAYHEARARGGAGLIVLEATAVHPTGLLEAHTLGGYLPGTVAGYRRVLDAVRPHGTRLFVQLFHAGREQIASAPRPPALAPSAVPSHRFHVEPRALRASEIEEIVAGYALAAERAAEAGLDGVEITAAHNYLLAQFFTPGMNLREDSWGAGPALLLEVLAAVRSAVPELTLGVRLSADSEAARAVAPDLAGQVDYLSLALGESSTYLGAPPMVPLPSMPENVIAGQLDPFRIGVPLIATTRVLDPLAAERILASGEAAAVGMTRALIADPELPRKTAEGRADEILRCIGCNACIAHLHAGTPIRCPQQVRTGRERTWAPATRAAAPRRLVVVGAGPAGLSAAAEAAAGGHEVVLIERRDRIGGQMALASAALLHAETAASLSGNYARLLAEAGVELRLGTEADAETIAALEPDEVLLATGAAPYRPALPLDGLPVLQSWDVLAGRFPEGEGPVLVADWGGDQSGLAAADLLAAAGRDVVFALDSASVGELLHQYQRNVYLSRLYRAGVRVEHHLRLVGVSGGKPVMQNTFAPERHSQLDAEAVVLSLGRVPDDRLSIELREAGLEPLEAGDCLGPRGLEEATLEGALAARRVGAAGR